MWALSEIVPESRENDKVGALVLEGFDDGKLRYRLPLGGTADAIVAPLSLTLVSPAGHE